MKYFVASEDDFFLFNPTAAAKDVFVHISAVEKAGLSSSMRVPE